MKRIKRKIYVQTATKHGICARCHEPFERGERIDILVEWIFRPEATPFHRECLDEYLIELED